MSHICNYGYIVDTVATVTHLFQFLHAPQLYVGQGQEEGRDDGQSDLVDPQMPRCCVWDALTLHVLVTRVTYNGGVVSRLVSVTEMLVQNFIYHEAVHTVSEYAEPFNPP